MSYSEFATDFARGAASFVTQSVSALSGGVLAIMLTGGVFRTFGAEAPAIIALAAMCYGASKGWDYGGRQFNKFTSPSKPTRQEQKPQNSAKTPAAKPSP